MWQWTEDLQAGPSQLTTLWAIVNNWLILLSVELALNSVKAKKGSDLPWLPVIFTPLALHLRVLPELNHRSFTPWAWKDAYLKDNLKSWHWASDPLEKSCCWDHLHTSQDRVFPMGLMDVKTDLFFCMCGVQTTNCSLLNQCSVLHLGIRVL